MASEEISRNDASQCFVEEVGSKLLRDGLPSTKVALSVKSSRLAKNVPFDITLNMTSMPKYPIRWQHFPKHSPCPSPLAEVVACFEEVSDLISSFMNDKQESNDVLAAVRPGLESRGFQVETSKKSNGKLHVPVLYGANGKVDKFFEADAYHPVTKVVLEVEAGRGYVNNQFLKDLFQACVMQDVEFAAIAVRQTYRKSKDYEKVLAFMETLYASNRLSLPLDGLLIIGY